MTRPHLLVFVDFGWFGIRAGAMYYDLSRDAFRPAFLEFHISNKWRVAFELGRVTNMWSTR